MVYDVCMRKRTNIYLEDAQLDLLGRVAEGEGTSVADLVRRAVDAWLAGRKVRKVPEDEWQRRFRRLLERRRRIARREKFDPVEVDREVAKAIREVRKARRARRR
jgi:ribbon-helix-helix CopG family protein